jgi:phosphatidylglycerophosphate synthase
MRVPESIRELRSICQLSPQWQVHQPWAFLQIRKASIYLTWVLLHLPVTANGVSLAGIIAGIIASVLFGTAHFGAGAITLLLAILFDFSDGEVSRYRKQQSKQGSYLDKVYHFTVQPSVFAGITIGAFQVRPSIWILVAGFVSTICVAAFVMVVAYANELAIWKHSRKLVDSLNASLDAGPGKGSALSAFLTAGARRTTTADGWDKPKAATRSEFARRFSELSSLWDFPYIFFVVTAAAVLQALLPPAMIRGVAFAPLEAILLFYAMTYPIWIALFLFHVLATESTERGYVAFADDLAKLLSRTSS